MIRTSLSRNAVLFLTTCFAASAAFAQKAETIDTGVTTVTLSSTFASALSALQVTVGEVAPTHDADGEVSFPIVGGAIDLETAAGNIVHSGGLTLLAGATQVRLQSFIIDTTGSSPVITGIVVADNKLVGRITLFDLKLPRTFRLPIHPTDLFFVDLDNVEVELDAEAAKALNGAFSVSAFKEGLDIGTANVSAIVNPQKE